MKIFQKKFFIFFEKTLDKNNSPCYNKGVKRMEVKVMTNKEIIEMAIAQWEMEHQDPWAVYEVGQGY